MAIKIAIANQKGGAGKTTTSLCLYQELKLKGYKVLFIDTDSQCNSTGFFGAVTEGEATMLDILCGDEPAKNCVQRLEYGDIIPSDKQLSEAENMVRVDERRFTHLKRSLRTVEKDYDFIIMDTPPIIGVVLKNVLAVTDYIVIPMDESGWAMEGGMDFYEAVDLARDNNEDLQIAGILITQSKPRTKKAARLQEIAELLADKMDTKVFTTKIRSSVACCEALTEYRVPLHEYDSKNNTRMDYLALTEEILDVVEENK